MLRSALGPTPEPVLPSLPSPQWPPGRAEAEPPRPAPWGSRSSPNHLTDLNCSPMCGRPCPPMLEPRKLTPREMGRRPGAGRSRAPSILHLRPQPSSGLPFGAGGMAAWTLRGAARSQAADGGGDGLPAGHWRDLAAEPPPPAVTPGRALRDRVLDAIMKCRKGKRDWPGSHSLGRPWAGVVLFTRTSLLVLGGDWGLQPTLSTSCAPARAKRGAA